MFAVSFQSFNLYIFYEMWTVYSALKMKVVALLMGILLNLYNENVCLYSLKQDLTEWIKTLTSLLRS